jgi:rare lipoprotein A
MKLVCVALVFVALISTSLCTGVAEAKSMTGMASYYKSGKRTANGESFNPNGLTAAHRNLPFGTKVKVTNLRNGKSVIVRINDRGPFIRSRIIDLSYGAAKVVGLHRSGVARVQVNVLN